MPARTTASRQSGLPGKSSPREQLFWRQPMESRNATDRLARAVALGNNRVKLRRRPAPVNTSMRRIGSGLTF